MADVEFTTDDCGKANGSAAMASTPLQVGDTVSINGSTDLSSCVTGESDACVYSIELVEGNVYQWAIHVTAQGPEGIGSGSMDLTFVDGTQDSYHLEILSSSKKDHSVEYDSSVPGITSFQWS